MKNDKDYSVELAGKKIAISFKAPLKDPGHYLTMVREVLDSFTPDEQMALAKDLNRIIVRKPAGAFTLLGGFTLHLNGVVMARAEKPGAVRSVFDPLEGDFKGLLAHELTHVLLHRRDKILKASLGSFEQVRGAVRKRIDSDPQAQQDLRDLIAAHKRNIYRLNSIGDELYRPTESVKLKWNTIEPQNREQCAVMLGFILSNEYYQGNYRDDAIQQEILCNLHGLASVYGKETVAALAPELLHYEQDILHQQDEKREAEKMQRSGVLRFIRRDSSQESVKR